MYPCLEHRHLPPRAVEVARLIATEGACNKVIGTRLALEESTVKVYIRSLLRAVGADNRTQLALMCHGLMAPKRGVVLETADQEGVRP